MTEGHAYSPAMALYPKEEWRYEAASDIGCRGIRFGPSGDLFLATPTLGISKVTIHGEQKQYIAADTSLGDARTAKGRFNLNLVNFAYNMCWIPNGDIFFAYATNNCILRISGDEVSVYTGQQHGYIDGPLDEARFYTPTDIMYLNGKLIVCDSQNMLLRIVNILEGQVSTLKVGDGSPTPSLIFKFPFGLAMAPNQMHIYVADLDTDAIFEVNLLTGDTRHFCSVTSPRSVSCLPSGHLLINSYSQGILLYDPQTKISTSVGTPAIGTQLYEVCIDPPTGRIATSGSVTQIISGVFPPHIEQLPMSLDYMQLRDENDLFPTDQTFMDDKGISHRYHSYILNQLHLTKGSQSSQPDLASDWASELPAKLRQIGRKFPDISMEVLFDLLYGSIATLPELNTDDAVPKIVEIAAAMVELDLDPTALLDMLSSILHKMPTETLCAHIAQLWTQFPSCVDHARSYHRALSLRPRDTWTLKASFGKSYQLLEAALKRYSTRPTLPSLDAPREITWTTPLQSGLWRAALALKILPKTFQSDVSPTQFVFLLSNKKGIARHVLVERWPLYCHWPWFKRLLDAGMSESRTGIAEIPPEFPAPLLLYIIGYCYAQPGLEDTKELVRHCFGHNFQTDALWNETLETSSLFCLSRGMEFGLVDMDRLAAPEFKTPVHWLHFAFTQKLASLAPAQCLSLAQSYGTPDDISEAASHEATPPKLEAVQDDQKSPVKTKKQKKVRSPL